MSVLTIVLGVIGTTLLGLGMRLLTQNQRMQQRERQLQAAHDDLQDTLNAIPDLLFEMGLDGQYHHCWSARPDLLPAPIETLIGKRVGDILSPEAAAIFLEALQKAHQQGHSTGRQFERRLDGERKWFELSVSRKEGVDVGDPRFIVLSRDITWRKLSELREQHQHRVLKMLSAKQPLAEVLHTIAVDVEAISPNLLCSILLLDQKNLHLHHSAAPSLPKLLVDALNNTPVVLGAEPSGTAIFTGERVVVEDIETHPWWVDYLNFARKAKLRACWAQPIVSGQGNVLGTITVYYRQMQQPAPDDLRLIEDEARLAALAIEKTEDEARLQLAASVFTHAREGILITDADANIIEVNDTFTQTTGYGRSEVIGKNPRILKTGLQGADFYAAMWKSLLENDFWMGEVWNRRKNGEVYAEMKTISAVRDAAGKIQRYVALFTDITPMKSHQQQLEHVVHYDVLTGLPNRVLLGDRLQHAMLQSLRRGLSLAVVFLDLDGFKRVNDSYGHEVGDALLIVVAQRMKEAMRDDDTLARTGGDEFVAVLADLERPQDCMPMVERMLMAAATPVEVGAITVSVSASIGVTTYPQDGGDADQLLRHADQAMYASKQAGKNRYHMFDVDYDAVVQSQSEGVERMRRGIEQGEFLLFYQPKVNMKTGEVIGAEALIRWQHPERGLLSPAAFLPMVENHPYSVTLGEWVMETALIQIEKWHAAGLNITVSVNVGAQQLQLDDFVPRLTALLAAYPGVPRDTLELEVLENNALEDIAKASDVMHKCRAIGVNFALDDFGTGYSSLTYLKRLPADVLKIDQSFVRDMLNAPDDLAIVEGVVGLSTAFHRTVLAEGVETVVHGEMLLSLGCELAQGYGIARPMPAAELMGWVAAWRPYASWQFWRDRTPSRDDLALAFTEVEHRHWLRSIEAYLAGDWNAPVMMGETQCHFSRWRDVEGRLRYAEHPEFRTMVNLHQGIHTLAQELVAMRPADDAADGEEVRTRLAELRALFDEFIAGLRLLIHSGGSVTWF